MCGFSEATSSYSHGQLLRPVLFESMYRVARESALLEKPGILSVFNGGSFLNAEEIPSEFQAYLAAEVSQDPDIKMLYIETRAEYVTEENLSRLKPLLLSKRLVLGIGLESITDHVRNQIIRKGLDLETYQSAINIAHEWGAAVRSYVLLKPHGLTESEAVQEAIATIRAAFAMGSDEVSLEASFVSSGTVLHKLYESGNFKTPSLYSIAQVLIDTASEGPVYLGKFTDNPPPIAAPDSCPLCSETMMELLDEFRNSLDTSVLAVLPECECRWKMR
jgi:radical SAM enzyme (TIGR01210 family)